MKPKIASKVNDSSIILGGDDDAFLATRALNLGAAHKDRGFGMLTAHGTFHSDDFRVFRFQTPGRHAEADRRFGFWFRIDADDQVASAMKTFAGIGWNRSATLWAFGPFVWTDGDEQPAQRAKNSTYNGSPNSSAFFLAYRAADCSTQ
jgi:hypothetical protein